jgi:hypothetical protein
VKAGNCCGGWREPRNETERPRDAADRRQSVLKRDKKRQPALSPRKKMVEEEEEEEEEEER